MENEEELAERKKKSSKKTESGSLGGIGQAQISEAFFEKMKSIGATMEQITRILRDWVNYKAEDLKKILSDFGRVPAKASAHLLVQFDGNAGFALVTDLLLYISGRDPTIIPTLKNTLQPR